MWHSPLVPSSTKKFWVLSFVCLCCLPLPGIFGFKLGCQSAVGDNATLDLHIAGDRTVIEMPVYSGQNWMLCCNSSCLQSSFVVDEF